MFRDLGIEIVQPDWPVIEAGAWTLAKVRKNILGGYSGLYQALRCNDPDPAILLRSDTEVPDGAEVYRFLSAEWIKAWNAGFRRIYFEVANEPNNAGYDKERWQAEGPELVADWISIKLDFPGVKFISPAMMPMLPGEAAGWHLPSFAGFPILGQHTYHLHGNFFWSPYNLNQLFLGKPIWVTEFNDTEPGGRLPHNIAMLETLGTMPYVEAVTFFCAGQWNGYGLSAEEATKYGEWFKAHKEEPMPTFDPQDVMDYWMKQPWQASEGYNEEDAFGQFLKAHEVQVGAQKCPDLTYGGFLFRFYAAGILYCKVNDWTNVMVAYSIRGLPPKKE